MTMMFYEDNGMEYTPYAKTCGGCKRLMEIWGLKKGIVYRDCDCKDAEKRSDKGNGIYD
jgi:hypothetical protein